MAVDADHLRIRTYPDPVLKQTAQPIERIDDEVRAVVARMIELMHAARGVGLAAPQVGLLWRMFVANPTNTVGDDRVYINPVLSDPTRELSEYEEGCLSIPNVLANIRRPLGITIEATNLDGETVTERSEEMPARVWQHETDHLDGTLIMDRMSPIDKMANRRALKELAASK